MNKIIFLIFFCVLSIQCFAQEDSTGNRVDSFLMNRKGLLGKLARDLILHKPQSPNTPIRNDLLFMPYKGKVIRHVFINRLDFGVPLADTSVRLKNTLTELANALHHKTREKVIRNNLFFKPGDRLIPYLVADNERHLRSLPYLQDVQTGIRKIGDDSVDIFIRTKDVLSIGGSYRMHSTTRMSVALSEDNIAGTGHGILLKSYFDNKRNPKFGYGAEYNARNLGGSFIDWTGGYVSFNKNFNTGTQNEEMVYTSLIKPLVNPYVRFTYAINAAWHVTHHVYSSDTLYDTNNRYRYYNYDAWMGWNTGAFKPSSSDADNDNRMRTLIGVRYVQQNFSTVPLKYENQYYYQYADLKAILSSVTLFRQDFYKARYVYGFGLNEDIPEGEDLSLIAGWTKKSGLERPYLGIDLQRYFFTAKESYFNYTLKADGYLRNKNLEDINLLFNVDYFSRLIRLGKRWKQRTFVTANAARQLERSLNEPLFLESDFGVREWRSDTLVTGDTRFTLKAESVFFTPWSFLNFRFAPFVFGNLCLFDPLNKNFPHDNWYNSIGGGIRTRNESLVFETMEFRAYYFPGKNLLGEQWRLEFNTNIRFRYNRQFEKKPDFVNVNVM
jgi:hypothetical protein